MSGLCYIDGLVSTGKKFPYAILKIIFAIQKNILYFFINIFKMRVDNPNSPKKKKRDFIPTPGAFFLNASVIFLALFRFICQKLILIFTLFLRYAL